MCERIAAMAEKRKSLTLANGVKVIEYAKANPRVGTRKIIEVFKCGRIRSKAS